MVQCNIFRSTLSSVVFALNALIIKPAGSIAPVVIYYLLNRNGYEVIIHFFGLLY